MDELKSISEEYVRTHFDLAKERAPGETDEQTIRRLMANLRWQASRRDRPPKFVSSGYGVKHTGP